MDMHAKLASTCRKSLNVYLLSIEELLGFLKTKDELEKLPSSVKASNSFKTRETEVERDIERNGESKCYDVMNYCSIKSLIPELAKLAKSPCFKSKDSEEDIILRKQIEIISYSNLIVKYDRLRYLDFKGMNFDLTELAQTMEYLSYRDTTMKLLNGNGITKFIDMLDNQQNKDTLEWRMLRLVIALMILDRVVDVALIASVVLEQIKTSVQ